MGEPCGPDSVPLHTRLGVWDQLEQYRAEPGSTGQHGANWGSTGATGAWSCHAGPNPAHRLALYHFSKPWDQNTEHRCTKPLALRRLLMASWCHVPITGSNWLQCYILDCLYCLNGTATQVQTPTTPLPIGFCASATTHESKLTFQNVPKANNMRPF